MLHAIVDGCRLDRCVEDLLHLVEQMGHPHRLIHTAHPRPDVGRHGDSQQVVALEQVCSDEGIVSLKMAVV